MKTLCFVGTYSQHGSEGIYSCALDPKTGELRVLSTTQASNSSFLCVTPNKKYALAVLENGETAGTKGGGVASFRIEKDGKLVPLNTQNIGGTYPCYVTVSPSGKWVVTSQYGDGTHTVTALGSDGMLGPVAITVKDQGTPGPKPAQKDGPHGHSAHFVPNAPYLITCDLGLDRVLVYDFNDANGMLKLSSTLDLPPGSGPRHFDWNPKVPGIGYLINEHGSTVCVLKFANGKFELKSILSSLSPASKERWEKGDLKTTCADIHVSADGKFVYGSNRGDDSIVVYAADTKTGDLTFITTVPCGGNEPRNFALVPDSDLLLCAHQKSDTIAAFHRGKDGIPVQVGPTMRFPVPVCIAPFITS